jgi:hypothetical protein
MTELIRLTGPDFTLGATYDGSTVTGVLEGNADYAAMEAVTTLLTRMHDAMSANGVGEAVVDFRKLEFMNSSCFKCFVSWIAEIQDLDDDKQYKIRLISNPQMHWQKRSLHALRSFAAGIVTLEG